jgi:hypothetical protein
MVGRWGNARPLPKVEIRNGHLRFVSPKEQEARRDDMVFETTLNGDSLSGTTTGPDGTMWPWTGRKAPALKRSSNPKWGKPTGLFNGKDLSGWKASSSNTSYCHLKLTVNRSCGELIEAWKRSLARAEFG